MEKNNFFNENDPVVDMEMGVKLAGNKPELAKELLTLFVKALPDDYAIIKSAFEKNDYDTLAKKVHKLHGAVSYCGLPRLKKIASGFENALKKNNHADVPGLFAIFSDEVRQVLGHTGIF